MALPVRCQLHTPLDPLEQKAPTLPLGIFSGSPGHYCWFYPKGLGNTFYKHENREQISVRNSWWEKVNGNRSHAVRAPPGVFNNDVGIDALWVGVFRQREAWKRYSCASFLTCESNPSFSGKNILWVTNCRDPPLLPHRPYFQPETRGCFLPTNQRWRHVRKILLPRGTQCERNPGIPWNPQTIPPLLAAAGTWEDGIQTTKPGTHLPHACYFGMSSILCLPFK